MPFDIQIAIAKLDFYAGDPDLSGLRDRYPELGFVFDALEDAQARPDELQAEYARERDAEAVEYAQEIDALECRVQDLRQAVLDVADLGLQISQSFADPRKDRYDLVTAINTRVSEVL